MCVCVLLCRVVELLRWYVVVRFTLLCCWVVVRFLLCDCVGVVMCWRVFCVVMVCCVFVSLLLYCAFGAVVMSLM